jgi:hypothetical protein
MKELEVEVGNNRVLIIKEEWLPTITRNELRRLKMTREELFRCFAEGIKLMREVKLGAGCRPVAWKMDRGDHQGWQVSCIWYSPKDYTS